MAVHRAKTASIVNAGVSGGVLLIERFLLKRWEASKNLELALWRTRSHDGIGLVP